LIQEEVKEQNVIILDTKERDNESKPTMEIALPIILYVLILTHFIVSI